MDRGFTSKKIGAIVLGASNVLMLSTLGAVRVSPVAEFALKPVTLTSISMALLGSTLVSSNQSLPEVSFAAIAIFGPGLEVSTES